MGRILWKPGKRETSGSQMARYLRFLAEERYGRFGSYPKLHAWSVAEPERFWESIWRFTGVIARAPYRSVLGSRRMPGADWFPGARLNFAENLLRHAIHGPKKKRAITAVSESRGTVRLSCGELLRQVNVLAAFLRSRGVRAGDRVGAVVSNGPEAIVGMLAATSVGAIWSSCSPDFGARGILDRFGQIAPKVLIAVDGYRYGGKAFDVTGRIEEVARAVPALGTVIVIEQAGSRLPAVSNLHRWDDILRRSPTGPIVFEALPFDHPVYILYSSGTTGVPKCIVHGAGGTLLQHLKELRLHTDVGADDRFFYFTTCGWMMWNWLATGLATGAELVLFDGSPSHPDSGRLWKLAERERISVFGTSAKFLAACRAQGLSPKKLFDLSPLRTILSTGSPLLPEDFDWVYANVKKNVRLSSISGGTDIVSCFVLGNPMLPVVRGEIQCKGLGMDVAAFDENGREVIGGKGELVCRKPAPSMPVSFWNDPDGAKYRCAYFDTYPDVWRHGDYVKFTKRGGVVIYGRSDATLNPGGIRIGTAEIYRQVETVEEVADSLAVGQPVDGDERVLLFVVLKKGFELTDELAQAIRDRIRKGTTPRHVPHRILRVEAIPYTISGKKVELAVAKILRGEAVTNRDALANPESLDRFRELARQFGPGAPVSAR